MPLIRIQGLTKLYRMGDSVVHALAGVDLEIERGELVAITGASGSGKSTIMHLIGCLDRPTSGTIVFDGRDVSGLSDRELADVRNRQIGFVFQTFNLINRTTALENVAVPLFYARELHTRDRARRALERVGLAPRATHRPSELSGGERQRVAIARAIVNDPPLVLADEPTGNLDTRTGRQIMEVFRTLNEQGVTVVLVTHEHEVAKQTRRIVQMRDGKIVSDRSTEELASEQPTRLAAPAPAVAQPVATVNEHVAASPSERPLIDAADGPGAPAASGSLSAPDEPDPEAIADELALGPPRMARGATGVLVCGLLAPVLFAACIALGALAAAGIDPSTRFDAAHPPPPRMLVLGFASVLALLLAIVLAVIAIFWGRGVVKRAREQPGNWLGLRRAQAARILGWVTVAIPLGYIGVMLAVRVFKASLSRS